MLKAPWPSCLNGEKKSETGTTASILKQDPNTQNVQKNVYLLGHKHNLQMFRVIPFVKLQNDT